MFSLVSDWYREQWTLLERSSWFWAQTQSELQQNKTSIRRPAHITGQRSHDLHTSHHIQTSSSLRHSITVSVSDVGLYLVAGVDQLDERQTSGVRREQRNKKWRKQENTNKSICKCSVRAHASDRAARSESHKHIAEKWSLFLTSRFFVAIF